VSVVLQKLSKTGRGRIEFLDTETRLMIVLVHDYGGYPFIFDLSKALAERGTEVFHIYSSGSGSPNGNFQEQPNLKVIDLGASLPKVNKKSFAARFIGENSYGTLIADKIKQLRPDLVMSGNTPLLAQKKLARACRSENIPFVFWLQDILSIAAENVLSKKSKVLGKLVGGYFKAIERACLHQADHVVAISEDFSTIIRGWGIDGTKVSVIENWSSIDGMPILAKNNEFSRQHSISNTFNFVYSGTLGMKQNPEVILEIASELRDFPHARVIVVAIGTGVDFVRQRMLELNLDNILLLPLQPFEKLPEVLASADVVLAMLESDASVYCVPSKILTYYCAGKPSLLILSKENLAARQTLSNGLGFVVEPGQLNELKRVVRELLEKPDALAAVGKKARTYAEKTFSMDRIAGQFFEILTNRTE
jgi:colanic acid biosynthesis glycosyl transferase WcaI